MNRKPAARIGEADTGVFIMRFMMLGRRKKKRPTLRERSVTGANEKVRERKMGAKEKKLDAVIGWAQRP